MGALDGITVLDASVMISGPLATMMLADHGAEVIKVETPGNGDLMRHLGSNKGGMGGLFSTNNRGKRSITIDLKQAAGREVMLRLAERADVLVQNYRPGAMDRLGFGYEDLAAVNPDLVYVSITGYGPDGPSSHRRVYDSVIQAASGIAALQTDPSNGEPTLLRTLVCDKVTSYTVAQAIMAALYARAAGTARGQHIEISMLDSAIAFAWPDGAMDVTLLDEDVHRAPTIGANYRAVRLQDGFVAAGAVSDSEFRGLCAAYGDPSIADDPRFATTASRSRNIGEMKRRLVELASRTTVAEFLERCEAHDVPAARVVAFDELAEDPQVAHNQIFVEREHPLAGRVREVRPPARLHGTPQAVGRPAPDVGEHTDEIVTELGFDPVALRDAGAFG